MNIDKLTANISLSQSERQVLEYIISDISAAIHIGIRGVAANNYTSTSTVMRLAKKLKYTGFVEMLYDLRAMQGTKKDNVAQSASSCAELAQLLKNNEILIYGQGFSEITAEYIYKKLLVIGRKCWCIQTLEFETVLKNFDGKIGAIVIISKSGKTPYMVDVAKKAKQSNTTVVAFTGNPQSELALIADILFKIEDDCPFDDENASPNNFFARVILAFEQVLRVYNSSGNEISEES